MGSFSAKAAYSRNSPWAAAEPGAIQQRPRVRAALA
jgi:hypothetical protein